MLSMGIVSTVNYAAGTVKVKMPDRDDLISGDLIVLQGRSKSSKDYDMPDIDELGLALFLPGSSQGFYLGSGYSSADTIPEGAGKGKRMVVFDDGTKVEYDKTESKLTVECVGDVSVTSSSNMDFSAETIKISASNGITLDGDVSQENGDYENSDGEVTASGIPLSTHVTTKVTAGLSKSGPPSAS